MEALQLRIIATATALALCTAAVGQEPEEAEKPKSLTAAYALTATGLGMQLGAIAAQRDVCHSRVNPVTFSATTECGKEVDKDLVYAGGALAMTGLIMWIRRARANERLEAETAVPGLGERAGGSRQGAILYIYPTVDPFGRFDGAAAGLRFRF